VGWLGRHTPAAAGVAPKSAAAGVAGCGAVGSSPNRPLLFQTDSLQVVACSLKRLLWRYGPLFCQVCDGMGYRGSVPAVLLF
jgi:hypothetical protein